MQHRLMLERSGRIPLHYHRREKQTRFISIHPVYDLVVLGEKMEKGGFR